MAELEGTPNPLKCEACMSHYDSNPNLIGAAASAGVKLGQTTGNALRGYLAAFHRGGHVDETGGRGA